MDISTERNHSRMSLLTLRSFRYNGAFPFKALAAFCVVVLCISYAWIWGSLPDLGGVGYHVGHRKPRIQYTGWENGVGRADGDKARQVSDAMKRTFWKYKLKAWGEDDIKPVTGGFRTSRNGWGAFIVDCATTLPLMGLWQELHLEIDHIINKIDFTNATELVDPFETTIRYLGGLVSLTNLIDDDLGPEANITKTQRDQLLAQAVTLARKLEPSFDSPTGMVWPRVNFTHDIPAGDPPDVLRGSPEKAKWKHPAISPARAGSNILENGALSKLTGDGIYLENATKAWAPLVWNKNPEEWPGIIDGPIDIFTGTPVGRFRSWDAPHDSYYEYLIKAHIFSPGSKHARKYRNRWVQAAESLREHLSSRANSTGEGNGHQQLYIGSWDDGRYVNTMHHFSCFAAGNLLLGGRYLGREDLFTFGLELLDSCHHIYTSTTTHIGPDAFHWIADATANHTAKLPTNTAQASMLKRLGFWSSAPHYTLRPEYVESVFYAWRITGEEKYRDWAWEAFTSIEAVTRARYGYGGLHNVFDSVEDASLMDYTESFWGGETLKYLYLTFSDTNVGSLDEWVYSTEGHPFKIPS